MSLLERIFYFHQEVLKDNFPNSSTISEQFEVSIATSKRDINYLRDRLYAPLAYDPQQHGFYYSDEGFSLPFQESPRIIFLLAMLNKLAGEAGLGELTEVVQLKKRLTAMVSDEYEKLIASLHCEWIEVETIDHLIFEKIIEAIVSNRLLKLTYRSVGGTNSQRSVAPLQIINYQGRWYFYAFCTLRNSNRLFHVARIVTTEITRDHIPEEIKLDPKQIGLSFGIFQGKPRYTAEILFTSTAADLVRDQHWHKNQVMQEVDEGILLKLPVSDDRELIMKVLQYGPLAKVTAPPELIVRIQKEITSMAKLYDVEKFRAASPNIQADQNQ